MSIFDNEKERDEFLDKYSYMETRSVDEKILTEMNLLDKATPSELRNIIHDGFCLLGKGISDSKSKINLEQVAATSFAAMNLYNEKVLHRSDFSFYPGSDMSLKSMSRAQDELGKWCRDHKIKLPSHNRETNYIGAPGRFQITRKALIARHREAQQSPKSGGLLKTLETASHKFISATIDFASAVDKKIFDKMSGR